MYQNRAIYLALASLILLALACNLPGLATDEIADQIGEAIEDQVQEAIETTANLEMLEDAGDMLDQFAGENFDEFLENFSGGEWTRVDVPLPPDAEVFAASVGESASDSVLLKTSLGIEEAEAWMLAALKENGWIQGEMQIAMGQARAYEFSKGGEGLSLVMNGSPDTGETNISITIFPQE